MNASNWIAVTAILATPITGVLAYLWGRRDKRHTQKVEHDRAVFARLDAALTYHDLKGLLNNLDSRYFLVDQGSQVDEFQRLFREPGNAFLLTCLQKQAHAFSEALRTMMGFAGEHCFFKDGDPERLWLHPDPGELERREAARQKLMPLIEKTGQRYNEFRTAIKEKLAV